MLRTTSDIITEFLVRNNRTTTDGFISDSTLQGWARDAHTWASGMKKWPMTEGRAVTSAASAATNQEGFTTLNYPEGFKADSIRALYVDTKEYKKRNFYKFRKFYEDNPADTTRQYADYGRTLYFSSTVAGFSGSVYMYGQFTPVWDTTDMTSTTIFSDYDEQGNEAIIEKMTSYLKAREHLPDEVKFHEDRATAVINLVKGLSDEEQFAYQDTNNDGWMKRFDVLRGGFKEDIFRRDQWGL